MGKFCYVNNRHQKKVLSRPSQRKLCVSQPTCVDLVSPPQLDSIPFLVKDICVCQQKVLLLPKGSIKEASDVFCPFQRFNEALPHQVIRVVPRSESAETQQKMILKLWVLAVSPIPHFHPRTSTACQIHTRKPELSLIASTTPSITGLQNTVLDTRRFKFWSHHFSSPGWASRTLNKHSNPVQFTFSFSLPS